MSPEGLGLLLTTLAGLATTFGSLAVFCLDKCKPLRFAMCMSFSAGVMVYISFVELLVTAREHFEQAYISNNVVSEGARQKAYIRATVSFFLGWIVTSLLDRLLNFSMHLRENMSIACSRQGNEKICQKSHKTLLKSNNTSTDLNIEKVDTEEADKLDSEVLNRESIYPAICYEEKASRRVSSKSTCTPFDIDNLPPIQHERSRKSNIVSSFAKLQHFSAQQNLSELVKTQNEEFDSTLVPSEQTNKLSVAKTSDSYSQKSQTKALHSHNFKVNLASALSKTQTTSSSSSSLEQEHLMRLSTKSNDPSTDKNKLTTCKQILKPAFKMLLLQTDATESDNEEILYSNIKFQRKQHQFIKLGLFTACALAIHNFPEGIATYTGALENPRFGIGIAVAIGLHNIPEGFAISVPIYYGTGSKLKGFTYSFISGFAEPVGALLAYLVIKEKTNHEAFGWIVGVVSGIMANIALKELYPEALKFDPTDKVVSFCFVFSMALIAMTLIFLDLCNRT